MYKVEINPSFVYHQASDFENKVQELVKASQSWRDLKNTSFNQIRSLFEANKKWMTAQNADLCQQGIDRLSREFTFPAAQRFYNETNYFLKTVREGAANQAQTSAAVSSEKSTKSSSSTNGKSLAVSHQPPQKSSSSKASTSSNAISNPFTSSSSASKPQQNGSHSFSFVTNTPASKTMTAITPSPSSTNSSISHTSATTKPSVQASSSPASTTTATTTVPAGLSDTRMLNTSTTPAPTTTNPSVQASSNTASKTTTSTSHQPVKPVNQQIRNNVPTPSLPQNSNDNLPKDSIVKRKDSKTEQIFYLFPFWFELGEGGCYSLSIDFNDSSFRLGLDPKNVGENLVSLSEWFTEPTQAINYVLRNKLKGANFGDLQLTDTDVQYLFDQMHKEGLKMDYLAIKSQKLTKLPDLDIGLKVLCVNSCIYLTGLPSTYTSLKTLHCEHAGKDNFTYTGEERFKTFMRKGEDGQEKPVTLSMGRPYTYNEFHIPETYTQLEVLNCSNTHVKSLNLPNLKVLKCWECRLFNLKEHQHLKKLPALEVLLTNPISSPPFNFYPYNPTMQNKLAVQAALKPIQNVMYLFDNLNNNSQLFINPKLMMDPPAPKAKTVEKEAKPAPDASNQTPAPTKTAEKEAKPAQDASKQTPAPAKTAEKETKPVQDASNQKASSSQSSLNHQRPDSLSTEEGWDAEEDDMWDAEEDDMSDAEDHVPSERETAAQQQSVNVNGKWISLRTLKCIEKLTKELGSLGKECGKAIDNGDCFWDAFAQQLSLILNKPVTSEELRQKVSEEVKRLDAGPVEENWVKKIMATDLMDKYEDYRDRVAYSHGEALKKGFVPVWGMEKRDGVILCHLYKVNLRVYSAAYLDEDESKINNLDNFDFGDEEYPQGQPYSQTVEMALYPGHFMPVHNTKGKATSA